MQCPGQDTRYWKPGAIFDAPCPKCGSPVEFFKDETTRKCHHCGHKMVNPRMDFGCASYCQHAEQCLGELPPELLAQRRDLLKDRVAVEMKRYFKRDFRRIGHATKVSRYAERIAREERGGMVVVLCSAYLHDIGIPEAERKHGSAEARYQEEEGPPIARDKVDNARQPACQRVDCRGFRIRPLSLDIAAAFQYLSEQKDLVCSHIPALMLKEMPFKGMHMNKISRILAHLAQRKVFCLATIVDSGNPQIPVGRKAIVWPDGRMEETFGSPPFDEALRDLAVKALAERESDTVEVADKVYAFFDILSPDAKLLICGAGHIAMPLARFAREVGFMVTVLDDRSDFAHPSRFPGCEVIVEDYAPALRNMPLGPSSHAVVITRGHEHDSDCLMEILPKETAYVGLIGSRRRIDFVLEELVRKGISRERCKEVFTPIGLPIGAESPEEIALSIVSELVCVRRRGPQQAQALRAAPGGVQ